MAPKEHVAPKSPCFCFYNLNHGSGEIIFLVSCTNRIYIRFLFQFAVFKSEVTKVQKFKLVQKSIHLAASSDIKTQWHFHTFTIFKHELQINAVTGHRPLDSSQSNYDSSLDTSSHISLELIQACTQCTLGPHSLGTNRPKYTANQSPPSGAKAEIQ
jgi:hypothetical protein